MLMKRWSLIELNGRKPCSQPPKIEIKASLLFYLSGWIRVYSGWVRVAFEFVLPDQRILNPILGYL